MKHSPEDLGPVADFLFEAGMLAKTPRSWPGFLGSGEQSVAEHLNRASYIGFALAKINGNADVGKVVQMTLFHDFAEARVSDLNYVHQKYTEKKEDEALEDMAKTVPFGEDIKKIIHEYEERESLEARLAKDSDNLEFLLSLKEQVDVGNERAKTWIPSLLKRLLTDEAKQLAEEILKTDSDHWWFGNKEDGWWIHRNKTK
jgi:putative hydrolase of HD superfamily